MMGTLRYIEPIAALTLSALAFAPAPVSAQQLAPGTYNGSFVRSSGHPNGLTLTIDSVRDGEVTGKAGVQGFGYCAGDYAMRGKYRDNVLRIRGTSIPGQGVQTVECRLNFTLTQQGDKLVGTDGRGRKVSLRGPRSQASR